MTDPDLAVGRLAGLPGRGDLLVLGPSLGTSVGVLWSDCAQLLGDRFEVVGWDLPGHGRSRPPEAGYTVADLAGAVAALTTSLAGSSVGGRRCWYAGVSLGGATGLTAALDGDRFAGVAVIASAARIGKPAGWHDRAALVRRAGTSVLVEASARRWFAPGSVDRHPELAARLLTSLTEVDDESYALACEALASYDVRGRLAEATAPVLMLPGKHDEVVTVADATATAEALPQGEVHVLTGCGHLPPAEDPVQLAGILTDLCTPLTEGTR